MHLSNHERRILRWSFTVRLSTLAFMVFTSFWVRPFDQSGILSLVANTVTSGEARGRTTLSRTLATPFLQWDTIHFLKIAKDGYAIEQNYAFLPGAPLVLRVGGRWLPTLMQHSAKIGNAGFSAPHAVILASLLATAFSSVTPLLFFR